MADESKKRKVAFFEEGTEQVAQEELPGLGTDDPRVIPFSRRLIPACEISLAAAKGIAKILALETHEARYVVVKVENKVEKDRWDDRIKIQGVSSELPGTAEVASREPSAKEKAAAEKKARALSRGQHQGADE